MDKPESDDPATFAVLQASRFWVQKVLVPVMVCIGIAGNTVTVMVLTRKRMRSSTNMYLSALAIADIIHLFFVFLLSFMHYSNIHDRKYELYWRFFGLTHWLCDAASSTSVWLTVSFTIERYIAVCHPIKGKVFCTERRAKSIIVIVYIFCILTTASTTFEYQLTLNDTCIKECKKPLQIGNKQLQNGSSFHHYFQHHTIIYNLKSPPENAPYPNFNILNDAYLQSQLKQILSNCTPHPHILYVPIYFPFINVSNAKVSNKNLIEGQVLNSKETATEMTKIQHEEDVLEKPPSKAVEYMKGFLENDRNKTDMEMDNTTCCIKHYTIDVESTTLGANETYMAFMYWYSAIFFAILPLLLIAIFNCFLIRAVYLSQKMRRVMTNSSETISMTNEKRITLMLIGVVVMFLICHTPTASILIYNNFHKSKTRAEINVELILGNFFNFLMITNASCNFLVYCVLSKKFRSTFKKIFFERRKKIQDTMLLSSTKSKSTQKFTTGRNASEYQTPRNLENQSLTSIPRSKSLIARPVGKARSSDLNV